MPSVSEPSLVESLILAVPRVLILASWFCLPKRILPALRCMSPTLLLAAVIVTGELPVILLVSKRSVLTLPAVTFVKAVKLLLVILPVI